jgi:LPXTG-motif cell wall-anchored protein
MLDEDTTNTATARGDPGGMTATDISFATVVVTPTTIDGGVLPSTSTPWYNILLAGLALMLAGGMIWSVKKHYDKKIGNK